MAYNNHLISIIFITFYFHIPIAFSVADTELDHKCQSNNKPFTSSYKESRALVVIDVIVNTPSNQGYRYTSHKRFNDNEWTNGLALCRGDVSADECKTCLNNASITLINSHCPDSRSAIIWHDYCFFKYSDADFLGKIDTSNAFISVSDSYPIPLSLRDVVIDLMASLLKIAIASPILYADDSSPAKGTPFTFYGMVQCTRDLFRRDCKACLDTALSKLSYVKEGGRVVYGSCNVRYETYNFLTK